MGLLPIAGFVLLFLYALTGFARDVVESAAARAARAGLAEAGAVWAEPRVSGQWVTLVGTPPSSAAAALAADAVRDARVRTLFGVAAPVTRVSTRFAAAVSENEAAPPPPPPRADDDFAEIGDASGVADARPRIDGRLPEWTFELTEGVITLTGEVADEAARTTAVIAAEKLIDGRRVKSVINNITFGEGLAKGEAVDAATLRGVEAISRCDAGYAAFVVGEFTVNCTLPADAIEAARAAASAPLPVGRLGEISLIPREAAAACDAAFAALLVERTIEFTPGSAGITPANEALLDRIAAAAADCPGVLRIEGHTDSSGDPSFNELLSRRRAAAVREALIERGLPADRLRAQGFGSRRLLVPELTDTDRARNRRIEIRVDPTADAGSPAPQEP